LLELDMHILWRDLQMLQWLNKLHLHVRTSYTGFGVISVIGRYILNCKILFSIMDVDSILHIDCKHENIGTNDNDLIKTDSK